VEGIGVSEWKQTIVETSLRVRYQETDQMGIVYHTNYMVWFEVGRTEFIRKHGYTYKDLEQQGLLLPVVDLHAKFIAPARYDERIAVRTWLEDFSGGKVVFGYEIVNQEKGTRLVTGTTSHLWVNKEMKRVNIKRAYPEFYELLMGIYNRKEG